jgi:hypothetical protein
MNIPTLVFCAKWLGGVVLYLAVSALVCRAFVHGMLLWAHQGTISRYVEYAIRSLGMRVFASCLFWGALYASPLAKPDSFGSPHRIWKHLVLSYSSSLLGCVLLVRVAFLGLPDFESKLALSAFPFLLTACAIVCFLIGIVVWVHLAFAMHRISPVTEQ